MNFKNGDKYTGDWIDDVITGQGVYIFASGNRYEGQFKDNKKHGKGTVVRAADASGISDKYTGDWIDDVRIDHGAYIHANGDRYEGQFKDNRLHGKGTIDFKTGGKYTGHWIDGIITGRGVYIHANGNRYEGQFKDNKRHGKGKMKYANGTVQEGLWSDNKFIG